MAPEDARQAVNDVAARADELLVGIDPAPFSPAAFSVFKGKITEYVGEVARESAALARRSQSDVISVRDVEAACERLTVSSQRRFYRHAGILSGLLLGYSTSAICSMIVSNSYPLWGNISALVTGILGAFLLGIHMRKD